MKPVDHKVFDLEREKYVKQLPPRDASLTINIQVESDKYLRHVPKLPLVLNKDHCMWNWMKWVHNQLKPMPKVTMSADTGVQVDTIGPQHLVKLGLLERNLLRSSMGLYCANDSKAQYLGVFLAKISGTSRDDGQERTVHTLVYVLKGSNCLMSKSTLMKLGCLPKAFPEIGRFNEDNGTMSMNQLAAGPPVTDSRRDYEPIPVSPMSESIQLWVPVRGKSGGGQDLPTTDQSTPLWVRVRGKNGGRQSTE